MSVSTWQTIRRDWQDFDRAHLWHPYSSTINPAPVFAVESASGVRLRLHDGRELIDGMASWWSVIHGYGHPELNQAAHSQIDRMSHVMFGGLTHEPALALAERLLSLPGHNLEYVFFADSGSVAIEVALKMALQYCAATSPNKTKFITIRGGYHGDTFGAMAVCDPETGMHGLFRGVLPEHHFVAKPNIPFHGDWDPSSIDPIKQKLERHADEIAAFVLEPIVQGAGGMWFYHPNYLREIATLCGKYEVLLIADEIATGLGRAGKLLACEYADVNPDILCLGKALTGGYMSLAATLASKDVADTISAADPGVFMHGPTFMANPLACHIGTASLDLLVNQDWQATVKNIEGQLEIGLAPCRQLASVTDVRVLGAIGVVELRQPIDMRVAPQAFVDQGVWVRPFGKLVYVMPPYVIDDDDLSKLTGAIFRVLNALY